jgi:hypothetical protein
MPVTNHEGDVFLNLTEIAERWGVTVSSIQRYHVGSGRLATRRDGKSHLVPVRDLRTYEARLIGEAKERIAKERSRLERLAAPIGVPDRIDHPA